MSLPQPTTSFTIPSLHDDLELDCRIYYPRRFNHYNSNGKDQPQRPGQSYAIIAHPYAPLGGSYDDPVVARVGNVLLSNGFLLGTFNFRGAAGSAGHTSWTGKAELGDYVSFYACMLAFINATQSQSHHWWIDDGGNVDEVKSNNSDNDNDNDNYNYNDNDEGQSTESLLILGGYSFGSLIVTYLPPASLVQRLLDSHQQGPDGSTEFEIKTRADQLAKDYTAYLRKLPKLQQLQQLQSPGEESSSSSLSFTTRGRTPMSPRAATAAPLESRMGGYSSEEASRRASAEAGRHRVRRSVDRVRQRLSRSRDIMAGSRTVGGGDASSSMSLRSRSYTTVAYLLISPLLPPTSSLLTMFSKPTFERHFRHLPAGGSGSDRFLQSSSSSSSEDKFRNHATCIVYGEKDQFTSSNKVKKWTQELQTRSLIVNVNQSLFCAQQIDHAGHFWAESDAPGKLQAIVGQWVLALLAGFNGNNNISNHDSPSYSRSRGC